MKRIQIYDTTLRDGSQGEDVSFSVEDKLHIAKSTLYVYLRARGVAINSYQSRALLASST